MGVPISSLARALSRYLSLFVRPEWRDIASAILTLFVEAHPHQLEDPFDLDPNDADAFLSGVVDKGYDAEASLLVLADALEFLVSRNVMASNPYSGAAGGVTSRLSVRPHEPSEPRNAPSSAAACSPTVTPPNRMITLREAVDLFFPVVNPASGERSTRGRSASTVTATYLPKWLRLIEWLEKHGVRQVSTVTRHHLKSFVDSLPTAKPQTKNAYIFAFRALWKEIVDDGLVAPDNDPTRISNHKVRWTDKLRRQPLTLDELAKLLNCVNSMPDEFARRSVRALLLTEAFGGPRVFETVAADISDIDWAEGLLHIRCGKGGQPRTTVVIDAVLEDLTWLGAHRHCSDRAPLFTNLPSGRGKNRTEQRITKNTAWRWLSKLGKDAGIHLYPHRLRHTAGTLAEQFGSPAFRRAMGVDVGYGVDATSMALLGHANATVNKTYNKVPLDMVRKVMEAAFSHVKTLAEKLLESSSSAA